MRVLSVYEVVANTDTNEGRGMSYVAGRFTSQLDAQEFSKGRGTMGTPAQVRAGLVLQMNDGTFRHLSAEPVEVNTSLRDMEVKEALSKLTPKERELLGLRFPDPYRNWDPC